MSRQQRWMAWAFIFVAAFHSATRADRYRWDNGELIPGTEGIVPGPGVRLDRVNLDFADFESADLTGASCTPRGAL
jgi:hypothetical protein